MENKGIDLDNLTKDDFMEMAKYVHHVELQNGQLVEQLRFRRYGENLKFVRLR